VLWFVSLFWISWCTLFVLLVCLYLKLVHHASIFTITERTIRSILSASILILGNPTLAGSTCATYSVIAWLIQFLQASIFTITEMTIRSILSVSILI
jgi:hypothetical protein